MTSRLEVTVTLFLLLEITLRSVSKVESSNRTDGG
jgi:hypothetical protein